MKCRVCGSTDHQTIDCDTKLEVRPLVIGPALERRCALLGAGVVSELLAEAIDPAAVLAVAAMLIGAYARMAHTSPDDCIPVVRQMANDFEQRS
jgi:hypothetical protein